MEKYNNAATRKNGVEKTAHTHTTHAQIHYAIELRDEKKNKVQKKFIQH